jgi:HlyD family secretion protein
VTNFPVKIRILDPHNVEVGGRMLVAAEGSTPNTPSFRPGMSGTVDVFTQTVRRAVAVPIQAVTVRDFNAPTGGSQAEGAAEEGGDEDAPEAETENVPKEKEDLRKVVFLMDNGKARQVEVETGISDDSHIVLTKGLQGNETVIIGPYRAVSRSLNDGDLVHEQKQEGDSGDRRVVVSSN